MILKPSTRSRVKTALYSKSDAESDSSRCISETEIDWAAATIKWLMEVDTEDDSSEAIDPEGETSAKKEAVRLGIEGEARLEVIAVRGRGWKKEDMIKLGAEGNEIFELVLERALLARTKRSSEWWVQTLESNLDICCLSCRAV